MRYTYMLFGSIKGGDGRLNHVTQYLTRAWAKTVLGKRRVTQVLALRGVRVCRLNNLTWNKRTWSALVITRKPTIKKVDEFPTLLTNAEQYGSNKELHYKVQAGGM